MYARDGKEFHDPSVFALQRAMQFYSLCNLYLFAGKSRYVGYNLFLDWIIVAYWYVFELFYKSIFFDFYIAFCTTYVALCEAKAKLHRESLTAERFVLEIKVGNGGSIQICLFLSRFN